MAPRDLKRTHHFEGISGPSLLCRQPQLAERVALMSSGKQQQHQQQQRLQQGKLRQSLNHLSVAPSENDATADDDGKKTSDF